MTLGEYLRLVDKTTDGFGAEIGVRGATIRRYRNGTAWPRREHMDAIVKATGGAVMPNDFLWVYREKLARVQSSAFAA